MAPALGYTFYDENGDELYTCAASMSTIRTIVKPSEDLLKNVKVLCACDVTNPLYGKEGAAYVFSPQKGADEKAVLELDCGLRNLANAVMRDMKTDISFLEESKGISSFLTKSERERPQSSTVFKRAASVGSPLIF